MTTTDRTGAPTQVSEQGDRFTISVDGRIVGVGHAGNPGIQSGLGSAYADAATGEKHAMTIGAATEVIAAEGAIVTAGGLLFVAGTDDNRLRAVESATGREVWVGTLAGFGNANPITYMGGNDRQYVAVAASDAVVAFALP